MARKNGSAKKAAKKAKERLAAQETTDSEHAPAAVLTANTKQSAAIEAPEATPQTTPPEQSSKAEQQAAPVTTSRTILQEGAKLSELQKRIGHYAPSKGGALFESCTRTLELLHDFQQDRYARYTLNHEDVKTYRECKLWLFSTMDTITELDKLRVYCPPEHMKLNTVVFPG